MDIFLLNIDKEKCFSDFSKYLPVVCPQRQQKIAALKPEHDKLVSILSELFARYVISKQLSVPFSEIEFRYNEYGKPYIEKEGFHFSLSHTKDMIALSTHTSPVGIDIEKTKQSKCFPALRFFTDNEQAFVAGSCERFFYIWTRKEAYVKMLGTGLSTSFKSFDVLSDELQGFFFTDNINSHTLSVCSHDMQFFNPNIQFVN